MGTSINTGSKKLLRFILADEEYGIDIRNITAIIEMDIAITRVPKTPDYIEGVINLRGEIIPIMNLRTRLNLPSQDISENSRVIIVNAQGIAMGITVDSVAEVIELADKSIESISNLHGDSSSDYIQGVGKQNESIITILDMEKLISLSEI